MTDTEVAAAFATLGVVALRNLSAREREAVKIARAVLLERLGEPRD